MTNPRTELDKLYAELEKGNWKQEITWRQQFNTHMLSHNLAADIKHKAMVFGLDVTLDSGSGLFSRSHLIKTKGTVKQTWIFWTAVINWMEANA